MNVSEDLLLKVLNGDLRGHHVSLRKSVAIGSNRDCDLHLRDAAVSWNHARLWRHGEEFLVEDLGSANGTFLNDRAIERASLQLGDRLRIGNTEISLLAETSGDAEGSAPGPVSAAPVVSGGMADVPAEGSSGDSRGPGRRISLLERAETVERELDRLKRERNTRLEAADKTSADLDAALERASSLEEERRRLRREVRKLEKRLDAAGRDHAEMEKRNDDVEQRLRSALEELENAEKERETLLRDHKALERERDEVRNEGEASRTRIRSLHSEIETLRSEIAARDGKSSQVEDAHRLEINELASQLRKVEVREHEGHKRWDSLSSESERLQTRYDETLESVARLQARIEESQAREANLGARLLEKERELALQEGGLATATAAIERLQKDSESLESALDAERGASRESISGLRRQCEELIELRTSDATRFQDETQLFGEKHRKQLTEAEERGRGSLDGRITELLARADRLAAEIVSRDEQITCVETERGEIAGRAAELELLLRTRDSEAESLLREKRRLEAETLGKREELEAETLGKREELEAERQALGQAFEEKERARDQARAQEVATLRGDMADLRQSIGSLEASRDGAVAELARSRGIERTLAEERDEARARIAELREKSGRQEEALKAADAAVAAARDEVVRHHDRQKSVEAQLAAATRDLEANARRLMIIEREHAGCDESLQLARRAVQRLARERDAFFARVLELDAVREDLDGDLAHAVLNAGTEEQRRLDAENAWAETENEVARLTEGAEQLRARAETEQATRQDLEAMLESERGEAARLERELRAALVDLRTALDVAETARGEDRRALERLEDVHDSESGEMTLLRGLVDELRSRLLGKDEAIERLKLQSREVALRSGVPGGVV